MDAPAAIAAAAGPVERRLRELLDAELVRWSAVDDAMTVPLAALRRFVLEGGKRLRPSFCHWGHVGAGGDPTAAVAVDAGAPLSAYGLAVGQAFQLRDDLLDAFGDPTVTGKPVGGDLREGKPTVLRAVARERASAEGARRLDRVGAPDLTDDEVDEIRE